MKGSWVIPIHSFANSLCLPPIGIGLLLLYGLGSRAFESKYGLGKPSSEGLSLPAEWSVTPKRCTSHLGDLENDLGNHITGTLGGLSVPILAGTSFLCGSGGGLGMFFFCTSSSVLTGPLSVCSCGDLGRGLITIPYSTLH